MAIDLNNQTDTEERFSESKDKEHSKSGTVWVSLIVFVVLLIFLAIFLLQNSTKVKISYFGFHGNISFAVAMLLATIAGSVLTFLIGSIRILQLKSRRKKDIY